MSSYTLHYYLRKRVWTQSLNFLICLSLPRVYFLFLKRFSNFKHIFWIFDGTNRLKTFIFRYNQAYLRLKSKQSIDMAGPCSILMGFDYTEAKLWKIRPFSLYFCLSHPAFCSSKTSLCSGKTSSCSEKTPLCSSKTPLCSSKTPLCSSKKNVYEKYVYE